MDSGKQEIPDLQEPAIQAKFFFVNKSISCGECGLHHSNSGEKGVCSSAALGQDAISYLTKGGERSFSKALFLSQNAFSVDCMCRVSREVFVTIQLL